MNTNEKQYRYPGTRPFTEDDRALFFGRKEDIERLSNQIKLEQILVLFGKSGLGKSSILNAGVLPLLKENNSILPLSIRFGYADQKSGTPATVFLSKIKPDIHFENVLWNKLASDFKNDLAYDSIDECFWLAGKSLQLENPNKTLLFVFDQFEELFLYTDKDISRFAELLSSLLYGQMPQSLQNLLIEKLNQDSNFFSGVELDNLYENVNIKIIISIRSDRLSLLNRLKTYIPQILQKTYELKPLSISQAKEAMLNPATTDGDFISQKFTYDPAAEEKIINYLSDEKVKQIETFQLQLICQYCENFIIKRTVKPTEGFDPMKVLTIESEDIGNVATIFSSHYDNIINEISDNTERQAARRLIEENMIIDNNRVPLPDRVISTKHNIGAELLQKLVNNRLLRSEPNTTGGYSYEISHDTLVGPILKSYNKRKEAEDREEQLHIKNEEIRIANENAEKERIKRETERKRQRNIIIIVGIAAVISIIFGIFGFVMWNRVERLRMYAENAKYELVVEQDKTKEANFNKYFSEGNRLRENGNYTDALQNYTLAKDFTTDTLEITNLIKVCTLKKEVGQQFEQLLQEGDKLQFSQETYADAMIKYNIALKLNYNNKIIQQRINELNSKIEVAVSDIKFKAKIFIDAGSMPDAKKILLYAKRMKPADTEIQNLLKRCQ
jgi:hypothetical protein